MNQLDVKNLFEKNPFFVVLCTLPILQGKRSVECVYLHNGKQLDQWPTFDWLFAHSANQKFTGFWQIIVIPWPS